MQYNNLFNGIKIWKKKKKKLIKASFKFEGEKTS